MITDLTGLDIANASLLDEGEFLPKTATAAAEAMMLSYSASKSGGRTFLVDSAVHPQTIACMRTRAQGFGIQVVVESYEGFKFDKQVFGCLVQYPNTKGQIHDYSKLVEQAHSNGSLVSCACDLMSLALLKPPGEWGADIAIGSSQRFGVPVGFGKFFLNRRTTRCVFRCTRCVET